MNGLLSLLSSSAQVDTFVDIKKLCTHLGIIPKLQFNAVGLLNVRLDV